MIYAIDPGSEKSAVVSWDGARLHGFRVMPNTEVLSLLSQADCPEVYCEWISSYGLRVGETVFDTCYWVGRFEQTFLEPDPVSRAGKFHRVKRMDIKRWHTGRGSSKDADVRGALIEKYGPPGKKASPGLTYGLTSHTWQAFALATYVTEGGLK